MDNDKIIEVCDKYREKLEMIVIYFEYLKLYEVLKKFSHLLYMTYKIKKFVEEDRIDKAYRWLGFLQGALWAEAVYTIDELKDHNKS